MSNDNQDKFERQLQQLLDSDDSLNINDDEEEAKLPEMLPVVYENKESQIQVTKKITIQKSKKTLMIQMKIMYLQDQIYMH